MPRFDDAGEPLPPLYDAGPAPAQPCAEGIRRVSIDIPSRLTRERRRIPRIVGDGTRVLVADLDETSIEGTVLGRLSRADALTGEVEWTTDVALPLSSRTNWPAPIGIRAVDGGWEVAWAQAHAEWLGAIVRFEADGTASEPIPFDHPPGNELRDIRAGTDSADGFLLSAGMLVSITETSTRAAPIAADSATGTWWGAGWVDDGELSRPNASGNVVGIFRRFADDGVGPTRMVVTSIDPLRWGEPLSLVELEDLEVRDVQHAAVVTVQGGTLAGVSQGPPIGLTLHWLDDALRERARASVAPASAEGGVHLVGAAGAPPWQAVALARVDVGIDVLFGIVREEGNVDGVMRPILTVPDRDIPHTAVLWSSAPRTFHVGWWRGDLEVLTFSCEGAR
ncbi:MAG: hypothetical protein IT379_20500 [Deltaproteobacteria bacterium]|nr:hypothetical protein [Deltaproteobacteria bacterium]